MKRMRFWVIVAATVLRLSGASAGELAAVGLQKQLFVDDYIIDGWLARGLEARI
ncbi:hypothetical protein OAS39_08780 [Pirellulales bacterium]|nr:hypothetical protein [Pirellulales bacterium]